VGVVDDAEAIEAFVELFTFCGGKGYVGAFCTLDLVTLEAFSFTNQKQFQQRDKNRKDLVINKKKNQYVIGTVDEGEMLLFCVVEVMEVVVTEEGRTFGRFSRDGSGGGLDFDSVDTGTGT
jgi:hypothetical protein